MINVLARGPALCEGDLGVLESQLLATTVPAGLAGEGGVPTVIHRRRRHQARGVHCLEDGPIRAALDRCLGIGSWPLLRRRRPRSRRLRTGRAGCWPATWTSAGHRGAGMAQLRAPALEVETAPWFCALTRRPRSTRWTVPPRCSSCSWAGSSGALTTTRCTPSSPCVPPQGRHRPRLGHPQFRHCHTELLALLRQAARTHSDDELHLVMDSYATNKTSEVHVGWRPIPAYTFASPSSVPPWLNMVEIFVSVIDRAAIRRRVFTLVKDFNSKIRAFINGWNRRCHPFTWI